jgi:UDP-3-O-[3-hydroxymyristoyl] glucosamine N-acyltransferase
LGSAEAFTFPESVKTAPTLIEVIDPAAAFFSLIPLFYEPSALPQGVSPFAHVDPTASIDPSAFVGAFAVVGPRVTIAQEVQIHPHVVLYADVSIGASSVLHSGVHVREQCTIGERCTLHNGVIIGADGFGYLPGPGGQLTKVPQVGIVRIGNDVEIGANACIDRATLGETVIGDGSKIDNLAQVGHNVQVGRSVVICGQVGIGGSARIGNHVVLGGQTGVKDHTSIAGGTRVAARSGVSNDLEPGDYAGYPAVPAHEWKRQHTALSRITKVATRLVALVRERR